MIQTNLLPWRECRRRQRLRLWCFLFIGTPLISSGIVISARMDEYGGALLLLRQHEQALYALLANSLKEVADLADRVEEKEGTARRLAARLADNQRWERRFSRLEEVIPDNVWLTQIRYSGDSITVEGLAATGEALTAFETESWLTGGFGPLRPGGVTRNSAGQLVFTFSWTREATHGAPAY